MTATVRDNPEESRFEIWADDRLAGIAEYHVEDGAIAFTHTETGEEFAGQGLGKVLARGALDAVRERGLPVLPYCPFIRKFIGRHPDYLPLVPEDRREKFGLAG